MNNKLTHFATIVLSALLIAVATTSCQHEGKRQSKYMDINTAMILAKRARHFTKDDAKFLAKTDSLYSVDSIGTYLRDYLYAYHEMYHAINYPKADTLFTDIIERRANNLHDKQVQIAATCELITSQRLQGKIEKATLLALDALKKFTIDDAEGDMISVTDYIRLYGAAGYGLISRGDIKNGNDYYVKSYELSRQYEDAYSTEKEQWLIHRVVTVYELIEALNIYKCYDVMMPWIERQERDIAEYLKLPDAQKLKADLIKSYMLIDKSQVLQFQGKDKEAAQAYNEYLNTAFSKTLIGSTNRAYYLAAAHKWQDAAIAMEKVDEAMAPYVNDLSLDFIHDVYLKKYQVNMMAGRKDTATYVAHQICQDLDSAITHFTHEKALEMASIYNTQQKDAEIAEQKASLLHTRVIALLVALLLVVVFFLVYSWYRRRAAARLEAVNLQLKEKNQQLTIANARAEESSRMKTKFIQQISHEIRTPLNILSGFAQVITAEGMELDEASRHDANTQILENTDRITGLVNKMLELSDASSRAVIELADSVSPLQIATQAVEASGITSAQHLDFQLQTADDASTVQLTTNLSAAQRIVSLLLDNAIKFTAPAAAYGHQSVPAADKQHATLRVEVTADSVQFVVEDSGIGVPPSEAEHIFEEFVQLDEYYDGTGIGLTVARSLARRLGGDVTLDTAYTSGARFILTLPR